MDGWFADFVAGLKKSTLIAGAAGTLLGIVARRQFHWLEALAAAGSGACCAIFVAPAAVRLSGYGDAEEIRDLAAFASGLLGMYLVDMTFALARDPLGTAERVLAVAGKGVDLWVRAVAAIPGLFKKNGGQP